MFSSGTPARFFAQFVKFDKTDHPDVRTQNAFTSLHAFPCFFLCLQSQFLFFFSFFNNAFFGNSMVFSWSRTYL